jgi:hypothetical protein
MLPMVNLSMSRPLDPSAVDELSHIATASLNSIEFLTAATLGLAHENYTQASHERISLISSKSPWEAAWLISLSPAILFSDFKKQMTHLHEIAQDYFEYVDSDIRQLH